jgi:hypothetical protein
LYYCTPNSRHKKAAQQWQRGFCLGVIQVLACLT